MIRAGRSSDGQGPLGYAPPRPMTPEPIAALRAALDAALVGQEDAKTGLLLALLAREHAYLEGSAGSGKSLLAETFARASGANCASLAFHRDTRDWDLFGDAVLCRSPLQRGERLVRERVPGPLLRAEFAVLDDLSRVPAQALGPLMGILSQRRFEGRALPLESAVATALAPGLEAYAEPLARSALDPFAIQIRMCGLLYEGRWEDARRALAHQAGPPGSAVLDRDTRRSLQERASGTPIPSATLDHFMVLLARLRALVLRESQGLLSDRSFGRMALGLCRAHATLRGASQVEPEDLRALRYMLARRIPEAARTGFEARLEEMVEETPRSAGSVAAGAGAGWGAAGEASRGALPVAGEGVRSESLEWLSAAAPSARTGAAEVDRILRALEGHFERGRVDSVEDPGGAPRSYRSLRGLEEIFDADPVDVVAYIDAAHPGLPRAYRRERRRAGGSLAILRDISASMEGRLSRWAGEVVAGLTRSAARGRMRLGYVEFNHEARRYHENHRFFHRRYAALRTLAAVARAEGRTNYEAPLRVALQAFRERVDSNHHIVFLTDGLPVLGDPAVRRERALARRLGVKVHSVFLGLGDFPAVLDEISRETGGLCFQARPSASGGLRVLERAEQT